MARPRRTSGLVYLRKDSAFWWITYWNRENRRIHESTARTDRQEAERFLRKRPDARDDGSLSRRAEGCCMKSWCILSRGHLPARYFER
jgi:hypothetical protein